MILPVLVVVNLQIVFQPFSIRFFYDKCPVWQQVLLGEVSLTVLEIQAGLRKKLQNIGKIPVHIVLLVYLRLEFFEVGNRLVNLITRVGLDIFFAVEKTRGVKSWPLLTFVVSEEILVRL